MRDEFAVHVQPAFVEESGEHQVGLAFDLYSAQVQDRLVPVVAREALAIGVPRLFF